MVWYGDLYKSKNYKKFGFYRNGLSYFMKKSHVTNYFTNTTIIKSDYYNNITITKELYLR